MDDMDEVDLPQDTGLTQSCALVGHVRPGRTSASVLRAALVGAAREARKREARQPTTRQRVLPAAQCAPPAYLIPYRVCAART